MFSRRVLGSCRPIPKAHQVQGASRRLATVAETPASSSAGSPSATSSVLQPAEKTAERTAIIHTGIVINRHPLITRTPTKFERAYYAYQSRIERALHNPFPSEFYFRPGSLLEGQFNNEELKRERKAFGRVAATDAAAKASQAVDVLNAEEPLVILPRRGEADKTRDVRSLNRSGDRNLYLVIKSKESGKDVWRFPQTELVGEELLHEAVKRDLRSEYAINMDTWVVSRIPVGVYQPPSTASPLSKETYVFFYKAHVLQGQVRPDGKNILDFAWLTKQEIQAKVEESYWTGIRDILSDF